jgi:hypothetical protein
VIAVAKKAISVIPMATYSQDDGVCRLTLPSGVYTLSLYRRLKARQSSFDKTVVYHADVTRKVTWS